MATATTMDTTENETDYDPLAKYGALLTYRDACDAVRLCRRSIEMMVAAGDFPKPVNPAGMRSVRFRAADIARWIANGCRGTGRRRNK